LPGTLAEGATIEMHTIPAQARCLQCATVYEPPDRIEPCPHCGSARKQWLSGQSLTLRSVEGESCRA
jgi:hydrogenase nickel incorporation protein HypA/HybF